MKTPPPKLLTFPLLFSFGLALHPSTAGANTPESTESNGFDEYLSFEDNQIPPGWVITFPYGRPGRNVEVANQRLQFEQVDTYAVLEKDKPLPAAADEVRVTFRSISLP